MPTTVSTRETRGVEEAAEGSAAFVQKKRRKGEGLRYERRNFHPLVLRQERGHTVSVQTEPGLPRSTVHGAQRCGQSEAL